jgi:hypothetical protein
MSGGVIGSGVIPITGNYASPYIKAGAMISLCWACLVYSGVAVIIVGSIAARARILSLSARILLTSVILLALLFSFGLSEAAFGSDSRGSALKVVATLLHLCSAAYFAVALLIVIAVILLPKRIHRTQRTIAD